MFGGSKMNPLNQSAQLNTHRGPSPGILAIVFMVLFNAGLYFVISFSKDAPHFPGPWESAEVIVSYFREHSADVLICAFFQFGAAVPLGIFTATMASRLRFLGVKAAGTNIALFGGTFASVSLAISALILWVMAYPGVAQEAAITRALYYLVYAIGGVGYSVPLGLLIAGISVTAYFTGVLPRWLVLGGLFLAVAGELSWLSMIFPKALFLIPLTRFPGFIWLIIAGFKLPKGVAIKR
jgi:hypothetical protein